MHKVNFNNDYFFNTWQWAGLTQQGNFANTACLGISSVLLRLSRQTTQCMQHQPGRAPTPIPLPWRVQSHIIKEPASGLATEKESFNRNVDF